MEGLLSYGSTHQNIPWYVSPYTYYVSLALNYSFYMIMTQAVLYNFLKFYSREPHLLNLT